MHLETIEAQTASLQAVAGLGPRVRRSRWMRAGENIRSNLHLKKLLLVMKSAPEKLILKNLIRAHLMLWWRSAKWAAVFGCCPWSGLSTTTGARHYLPNQQTTCGPSECAPKTDNPWTNPLPFFVAIFETRKTLVLLQKFLDLTCLICSSTSFFFNRKPTIYWFNPIWIYALFL